MHKSKTVSFISTVVFPFFVLSFVSCDVQVRTTG